MDLGGGGGLGGEPPPFGVAKKNEYYKIEYITFDNKTLYCAPKLSQNAGNAISET